MIPVIVWDYNKAKHEYYLPTKTPKTAIVTGRKVSKAGHITGIKV